ncbi:hypothetical protein T4E_9662 [Trichinella pseudospiralis]|uniref:Uncharacterized protein n=1 Tax=Trichinella pseudospiralis TaxID=6337 RepID=A0A0V0Y4Z6_TRIPS|nr:hypothetical protein T4E_9662 [Trichinella pseudospiralis]
MPLFRWKIATCSAWNRREKNCTRRLLVLFERLDTFEEYDKYPDILELRDAILSVAKELEKEKVDEDQPGCSGTTTD